MAYCSRCGTSVADDSKFCPFCGKAIKEEGGEAEETAGSGWDSYSKTTQEDGFDIKDVEENKLFSALCYLNVLVFIPLLLRSNSPFVRYHCNQGLILLIVWFVTTVLAGFIPLVGWIIRLAGWLFGVGCIILGIRNTLAGRAQPLPLIGEYKII